MKNQSLQQVQERTESGLNKINAKSILRREVLHQVKGGESENLIIVDKAILKSGG